MKRQLVHDAQEFLRYVEKDLIPKSKDEDPDILNDMEHIYITDHVRKYDGDLLGTLDWLIKSMHDGRPHLFIDGEVEKKYLVLRIIDTVTGIVLSTDPRMDRVKSPIIFTSDCEEMIEYDELIEALTIASDAMDSLSNRFEGLFMVMESMRLYASFRVSMTSMMPISCSHIVWSVEGEEEVHFDPIFKNNIFSRGEKGLCRLSAQMATFFEDDRLRISTDDLEEEVERYSQLFSQPVDYLEGVLDEHVFRILKGTIREFRDEFGAP